MNTPRSTARALPEEQKIQGLPRWLSLPLYWFYSAWCATLRREETGREAVDALFDAGQPLVVAMWHDELFPIMSYKRQLRVVAVVSRSRDGDWLAALLHRLGIGTARGSSSRGGMSALREITVRAASGECALLTVDGPRGPRHTAKPGAVHLAARENLPLVPCRVLMEKSKKFGSWDRFQLPLPGSRVRLVWGEPYIPVLTTTAAGSACADPSVTETAAGSACADPSVTTTAAGSACADPSVTETAAGSACADLEARLAALCPPDWPHS